MTVQGRANHHITGDFQKYSELRQCYGSIRSRSRPLIVSNTLLPVGVHEEKGVQSTGLRNARLGVDCLNR